MVDVTISSVIDAPVEKVWARDGYDVRTLLQARLDETSAGALDPKWVGQQTSGSAFWGLYRGT